MDLFVFGLLATLLILGALTVVLHPDPVYSALALIVVLVLLAVMFVTLEAHLIAAFQIIVYAGAIMVLFLFVIMLLGTEKLGGRTPFRWLTPAAMLLALLFLGIVAVVLTQSGVSDLTSSAGNPPAD